MENIKVSRKDFIEAGLLVTVEEGELTIRKAELKKFLVRHGAYRKFCNNVKQQYLTDTKKAHKKQKDAFYFFLDRTNRCRISGAFTWEGTPEDNDYWLTLHLAFEKHIKNKKVLYNA